MARWTPVSIRARKGGAKIPALTAYDYTSARLLDQAGIPLILVGDSLAMTMLGHDDTLAVTMEEMLHHVRAVRKGVKDAVLVADMPFMSYQVNDDETVRNALRFLKEASADAVKIEGGTIRHDAISRLVENGIPVMGHVGLLPQSVKGMGGFKVQGRSEDDAKAILEDARSLEDAGVFAMVIEGVPAELGKEITRAVSVPTIGIGAGPDCDGQILVLQDMLGMNPGKAPKFVKKFAELGEAMTEAFTVYRKEVEGGQFPSDKQSYS